MEALRQILLIGNVMVLIYFFAINTSYLVLTALAIYDSIGVHRRHAFVAYEEAYTAPSAPAVSVIVPAYNEEVGILESIGAMLSLRYPAVEIVVVDDGSTDGTFELLREKYDLVQVPRVFPNEIPVKVLPDSVWVPRLSPAPLLVIRKPNSKRADTLNMGLNFATSPLVCMVDADSILDASALLTVVKPFLDDPVRMAGTGGVVRIANGCKIVAGQIVDVRMPHRWLPRIQVVEYLRAFLLGRAGWSHLRGLMVISGAFGVFRRDLLVEMGGLDADTIGEDSELVVRCHRYMRRARKDYKITFVGEPVCWTEVPSTLRVLGAQRRRWQRGLSEIMRKHRGMILNPRYGRVGLVSMPYYFFFEFLSPLVELGGLFVLFPISLALGAVNWTFALQLLLASYGFAIVVDLFALAAEEYLFHRYRRLSDLIAALAAAVVENIGFRQLVCIWRLQGMWGALTKRHQEWGVMSREGFSGAKP